MMSRDSNLKIAFRLSNNIDFQSLTSSDSFTHSLLFRPVSNQVAEDSYFSV